MWTEKSSSFEFQITARWHPTVATLSQLSARLNKNIKRCNLHGIYQKRHIKTIIYGNTEKTRRQIYHMRLIHHRRQSHHMREASEFYFYCVRAFAYPLRAVYKTSFYVSCQTASATS